MLDNMADGQDVTMSVGLFVVRMGSLIFPKGGSLADSGSLQYRTTNEKNK
jgi:hypothetical protein